MKKVYNKKQHKKIAWFKWPVNLLDDERIAELIAQKGVAGFGVYVCLICEIYRRQSRCLTLSQVKALKFSGATQKTIMAVVNDFGLFRKDQMGHVYSAIDYLGFDDADESASDVNDVAIGFESASILTPAYVHIIDEDKDEDKDHHHDDVDFIGQIPEHSEWTEIILMKSGFGNLIKRNWQTALAAFRNHAVANCTIKSIRSVDDAKKYFHYYVTNPTSGNMLRKTLEDYEKIHPQQNPFQHEDVGSAEGHRSYHGIPLPDDAPPRPDERAEWDFECECWVSPTNNNM